MCLRDWDLIRLSISVRKGIVSPQSPPLSLHIHQGTFLSHACIQTACLTVDSEKDHLVVASLADGLKYLGRVWTPSVLGIVRFPQGK